MARFLLNAFFQPTLTANKVIQTDSYAIYIYLVSFITLLGFLQLELLSPINHVLISFFIFLAMTHLYYIAASILGWFVGFILGGSASFKRVCIALCPLYMIHLFGHAVILIMTLLYSLKWISAGTLYHLNMGLFYAVITWGFFTATHCYKAAQRCSIQQAAINCIVVFLISFVFMFKVYRFIILKFIYYQ